LLECDYAVMSRYDPDDAATIVEEWARPGSVVILPPGQRIPLGDRNVHTLVARSHRPARLDDYGPDAGAAVDSVGMQSAVGAPIVVEGRLWGVMIAGSRGEPLPTDTEARLAGFTELVATAIANAQARTELHGSTEEQAALRQVATLVARGVPPEEVFAAVTDKAGRLLLADETGLGRYDGDGVVFVGVAGDALTTVPVGTRATLGGRNISTLVFDTGRPARIDDYSEASGEAGKVGRPWVNRSALGVPVRPGGRLWGVFIVMSRTAPFPPDTEDRLAGFTELVATAVANAETQAQLTASRARIVATADATRRRIERDLHDGVQQHLVSLALALRGAREALPPHAGGAAAELDRVARGLRGVLDELREITRGIHPAALAQGGLRPALRALARRSAVPVRLDAQVAGRLPEPVEIAAYYVVAEALTNAAKHARARVVDVTAAIADGVLQIQVRDDGRGGADAARGSGLIGLADRVEALGGRVTVHSPPGSGTMLRVTLPLTVPTESELATTGIGRPDGDGAALSIGPDHPIRPRDG
jgi:signal transduction histidine kinase